MGEHRHQNPPRIRRCIFRSHGDPLLWSVVSPFQQLLGSAYAELAMQCGYKPPYPQRDLQSDIRRCHAGCWTPDVFAPESAMAEEVPSHSGLLPGHLCYLGRDSQQGLLVHSAVWILMELLVRQRKLHRPAGSESAICLELLEEIGWIQLSHWRDEERHYAGSNDRSQCISTKRECTA